ncbi:MAG: hypothetical protein IKG15_00480 [Solobacterium sp.]|nr:hypothetical protein [Solobacterium sp.]
MPREFVFEVVEEFSTLSEKEARTGTVYTKEFNLISYNGSEPVYDIRNWTENDEGKRMGKGITLNKEELKELRTALNQLDLDEA